jgi:hypothetical protein
MLRWDAAAVLIGAVLGILMGFLWGRIVSKDRSREFYRQIGKVSHSMLTAPDADFLTLYKTLIRETGRFLGVQFLGIFLSLSPLIALFWVFAPGFHHWRNSQAEVLSVHPAEDAQLLIIDKGLRRTFQEGRVSISALSRNGFGVSLSGKVVLVQDARANNAICPAGDLRGLLLQSLGFNVSFVDKAVFGADPHLIIVRPWRGDTNPLWPYLSDPELFLWAGMGIFSLLAMYLFSRRRGRQLQERQKRPGISFMDYLLVTIAFAMPGVFRRLGDKESHCFKKALGPIQIDRPIFVAGLARSGTTILLELLSSMPSVATHQYRDFPFVMTPVLWQRFTTIFSSREKNAMERPHRDGILITRESPEAFEEPIWQYFFPHVHRENISHVINEDNGDAGFADFFADHIRKILLIRNGTRYLSKGNYNVTRIRYLASLFPDARFIIPVRHPIEHVLSLVRQHRLFESYAEEDDRVPDYLCAAGHYEFGPQRVPICLEEGDSQRILDAWRSGREHVGYAIQWANVYRFVHELARGESAFADRILVLRYEDLCAYPVEMLTRVVNFCNLDCGSGIAAAASRIESGKVWTKDQDADICLEIWEEVRDVAKLYGYQFPISQSDDIGWVVEPSIRPTDRCKTS